MIPKVIIMNKSQSVFKTLFTVLQTFLMITITKTFAPVFNGTVLMYFQSAVCVRWADSAPLPPPVSLIVIPAGVVAGASPRAGRHLHADITQLIIEPPGVANGAPPRGGLYPRADIPQLIIEPGGVAAVAPPRAGRHLRADITQLIIEPAGVAVGAPPRAGCHLCADVPDGLPLLQHPLLVHCQLRVGTTRRKVTL